MAGMTWVCLCGTTYPNGVTACELDGIPRPEATPDQALSGEGRSGTPATTGAALPSADRDVNCSGCGRANAPGATHCFRCNDPLSQPANDLPSRLVLPGNVIVCLRPDETVLLGREAVDPTIKAALEHHDQVSRRHAELLITGTAARIRDLGSTNGTYVNDIPVNPETTVPIGNGLRLRFGQELELTLMPGGSP